MTEYELVDIIASIAAGNLAAFSLYLAILTAYMVAAFVVGERLTKIEVVITSSAFISATLFFIYVTIAFLMRQIYFLEHLAFIETDATLFIGIKTVVTIATVQLMGILVGLKFMWEVRNRKTKKQVLV